MRSCREATLTLNISDLSNKNAPYRFCTERLLVLKVYYLVGYHRVGNKLGGVKVFFVHINSGYLMSVVCGVIVNAHVGIATACINGYLILALGNFAAASLLVN